MVMLLSFALLINAINLAVSQKNVFIEDYYWRDFEGILPPDALPGGMDANGRPIYIGQVLFEDKLVPGKIYQDDKHIYYQWGPVERKTTSNIKILCTQSPQSFEWIPTEYNNVLKLTNKHLVSGGSQPGHFSYIGRAYAAGETTIGKMICRVADCLGMFITKDGKGIDDVREPFEVLSYENQDNQI